MGMFDYIKGVPEESGYDDQVKLWENTMRTYEKGDFVPCMRQENTYSVRLNSPEGAPPRYIKIEKGIIVDVFSEEPIPFRAVFDKWGGPTAGYQRPISPIETALKKRFPPELQASLDLICESFGRRHHRSERNFERELETVSGKWFQSFKEITDERHLKYACLLLEFLHESFLYDRKDGFNMPGDALVEETLGRLISALKKSNFEQVERHVQRLRDVEDIYKRDLWSANREFISGLLIGDG